MTRFKKIIVVVLGILFPVVSLGYIVGSWALQGTPAELKDKITVIRDKRFVHCRRLPLRQRDGCDRWAKEMWQMQDSLLADADKRGQEALLKPLWQDAAKAEAEIAAIERRFKR